MKKILEGDFNGIADIIWAEGLIQKTGGKLNGEKQ